MGRPFWCGQCDTRIEGYANQLPECEHCGPTQWFTIPAAERDPPDPQEPKQPWAHALTDIDRRWLRKKGFSPD